MQIRENNENIRGLVVSKVEMILTVLKFGLVYNLYHTAMADLFKMINTFIGSRILPDARCVNCDNNISLKSPTYNDYFALIDNDNNIVLQIKENFEYIDISLGFVPDIMHCICLGIAEQLMDIGLKMVTCHTHYQKHKFLKWMI
ncbi:hypothetical protein TSAR_007595 [Trichomalopsis sarcophagae]|uniref:Uncharacterized protein n=1 Tax=Trichomalopsis sarcophagae TaxID=543379 RepID=A0A232EQI4_9HYME|nr:hypothetical protein TSAR_007595 [Trichomalopsis sarcophagae]